MNFIHLDPSIQNLLTSTSEKLTNTQAVWKFQNKYKRFKNPSCLYNSNKYDPIDVNREYAYGMTLLIVASSNGNKEFAKILLDTKDININLQDNEGWTALIYASWAGHEEIVKMLIAFAPPESSSMMCVDINLQDECGATSLNVCI